MPIEPIHLNNFLQLLTHPTPSRRKQLDEFVKASLKWLDIDCTNENGMTLLGLCASHSSAVSFQYIQCLLKAGADPCGGMAQWPLISRRSAELFSIEPIGILTPVDLCLFESGILKTFDGYREGPDLPCQAHTLLMAAQDDPRIPAERWCSYLKVLMRAYLQKSTSLKLPESIALCSFRLGQLDFRFDTVEQFIRTQIEEAFDRYGGKDALRREADRWHCHYEQGRLSSISKKDKRRDKPIL